MSGPTESAPRSAGTEPVRRGLLWSSAEDMQLRRSSASAAPAQVVARQLQRSVDEVRSRMESLGLTAFESSAETEQPAPVDRPLLTMELVPQTCWYRNLRKVLSTAEWDALRKPLFEKTDWRCEICSGKGERHPVECNEQWAYDDIAHVQRLDRLVVLCPGCHEVKHMGHANLVGRASQAFAHLQRINHWDAETTNQYIAQEQAQFDLRSEHEWSIDVSALEAYGVDAQAIQRRFDDLEAQPDTLDVRTVTPVINLEMGRPPTIEYRDGHIDDVLAFALRRRELAAQERGAQPGSSMRVSVPKFADADERRLKRLPSVHPVALWLCALAIAVSELSRRYGDATIWNGEFRIPRLGHEAETALVVCALGLLIAGVLRPYALAWLASLRRPPITNAIDRTISTELSTQPTWVASEGWAYLWDGRAWTTRKQPLSRRSGWFVDPEGHGLRWWNGWRWTSHTCTHTTWVKVRPLFTRTYGVLDGQRFTKKVRFLPVGSRVRPKDRNNRGTVEAIDLWASLPASVRITNREKGTTILKSFDFRDLRRGW